MDEQFSSPVSKIDRISALPDETICIILSKLSVEESARTSILSKRWPKMWLLSPITISDKSIIMQSCNPICDRVWIVNALSHIISTHPGPVHSCYFSLPIWEEHCDILVQLLRTLTQKGILNLEVDFDDDFLEVPFLFLECKSLVDVKLDHVLIRDQLRAGRDIFPSVSKLTMVYCNVSDEFLVNLLCSNSIVELKLDDCYGLEEIVIESGSLQSFFFQGIESDIKLVVKDAPNLESFKCYGFSIGFKVVILNAPKLKVLRWIDMEISILQLGNYRFKFHKKYMEISGEITYMPSLRSLEIIVNSGRGYEAKTLPHFLMCFPCLETLQVQMITKSCFDRSSDDDDNDDAVVVVDDDYDSYVHMASNINCLNHHLKNLWVRNYSGMKDDLDFAKHIIVNARVLETATLVYGYPFQENWIESQRQCLMQNRASEMLRVEFL